MNINGFQKNNVAFGGGKVTVSRSLKGIVPYDMKGYEGFNLCLGVKRPQKGDPWVVVSLVNEKKQRLERQFCEDFTSEKIRKLPETIKDEFHFRR